MDRRRSGGGSDGRFLKQCISLTTRRTLGGPLEGVGMIIFIR